MENDKQHFFDHPKNVKRILYFLYGACAILLALDFVIHRHIVHSWENLWGFYPIYGFIGCVILVFVATWMRTFLMRPEDYYEQESKLNVGEEVDDAVGDHHIGKAGGHNVDA